MTEPPASGAAPPEDPSTEAEQRADLVDPIINRLRAASGLTQTPRRIALRRLADAARVVIDRLVGTDAPDEVIAAVTADLEAAAQRLAGYHQGTLYGFAESANAGGDP